MGRSSILAWGKSRVSCLQTAPFLHYVSTIKYYWSIEHCSLLLFFKSYFCTFPVFVHFSLFKKKNCPWTQTMDHFHGPSPWKWSMYPVQIRGPWTRGPCFVLTLWIMVTKIPWTAMRYFSSYTSQLAIEVSFAVSFRLRTSFREVIPGETFTWNNFEDGQHFDLHSFVGKSIGTLFAVNNLQGDLTPRYTHISSASKANPEDMNNHLNFLNFHGTY